MMTYIVDRYRRGILMAQGARIEYAKNIDEAKKIGGKGWEHT